MSVENVIKKKRIKVSFEEKNGLYKVQIDDLSIELFEHELENLKEEIVSEKEKHASFNFNTSE